jgi:3-dehydroquinate synthase
MESIVVQAPSGAYNINFGPEIWQQVGELAKGYDQALVVSDKNVAPLYGDRLPFPIYTLEPGEETKNIQTISEMVDEWAERGLGRYSLVIALGGGVVGDLVGLTASVYRRGIAYVQIPTTLVAQVDSGVGGKTGVNTPRGKNLVGTFYQPWGVYIDPSVLSTLPEREITNGLGEILKYGVIQDPALFQVVQEHISDFYDVDLRIVGSAIRRCLEIKGDIVGADELDEQGVRRILNHGHTFGHAIEKATGFKRHNHGEAVLMGMLLEARLSHLLGMLPSAVLQEIEGALFRVRLDYSFEHLDKDEVFSALHEDKKNRASKISFILPREIGRVEEVLLSAGEVEKYWNEVIRP